MSNKILITGAAGFIGHHYVQYVLDNTDWDVIALDRLDYSGSLQRLSTIPPTPRLKIVWHDLKAPFNPSIKKQIGDVDYVVHMAAGSHVDRSIDYPLDFAMDNVIGTVNTLDFARLLPDLKRFVYFSTDEVFGPAKENQKFSEYDRYNSTNPYSASKAAGEEFCVAYENTFEMPIVITHCSNVFGIRQDPEKFIPKCIKHIMNDQIIDIHCDENNNPGSRYYIHIDKVCEATMLMLTQHVSKDDNRCPKYNIIGDLELDNLELAKLISDIIGKELKYNKTVHHHLRPNHDIRYDLSCDRLKKLGWSADNQIMKLDSVIRWHLENLDWL